MQRSAFGEMLAHMYPTHLQATCEGFALNLGARILSPVAPLLTTQLVNVMPVSGRSPGISAGAVAVLACSTSFIGSFWLRGPRDLNR